MKKKRKIQMVDPETGLKAILYDGRRKKRWRWDEEFGVGVMIEPPALPKGEDWELEGLR